MYSFWSPENQRIYSSIMQVVIDANEKACYMFLCEIHTVGLNLYISPYYVFLHILFWLNVIICQYNACMLLVALWVMKARTYILMWSLKWKQFHLNMIGLKHFPKIQIISQISVQCCMLEVIFKHDLSE